MELRGKAFIWFAAGLAAIIAGFWPTFFGDLSSNDLWHTIHGCASTLWVVLLITQSLLIRRGKRLLHQRLGWLSLILVAVLLVTSAYMVWIETFEVEPFPRELRLSLIFLDATLLVLFTIAYGLGLLFRRQPRLHARLMGSTILIGLGPALGRLYAEHIPTLKGLAGALPWTFWTIEAVLAAAIVVEFRRGKVLWPFPAMLAAFVTIEIGSIWATGDVFASGMRAVGAPI